MEAAKGQAGLPAVVVGRVTDLLSKARPALAERDKRLAWLIGGLSAASAAAWLLGPDTRPLISLALAAITPFAAVYGISRFRPPRRLAWLAFTVGTTLVSVAQVLVASSTLLGHPLIAPGPADWLLAVGCWIEVLALVAIIDYRSKLGLGGLVDGVIITAGVAAVCWAVIFDPALRSNGPSIGPSLFIATVSSADVVRMFVAAVLLVSIPRSPALATMLALGALVAVVVSDAHFAYGLAAGSGNRYADLGLGWPLGRWLWVGALLSGSLGQLSATSPERTAYRFPVRRVVVALLAASVPLTVFVLSPVKDPLSALVLGACALTAYTFAIGRIVSEAVILARSIEARDEVEKLRALERAQTGRLAPEIGQESALPAGTLVVWYQPVIDLEDDQPMGFEALARWQLDNGRVLGAEEFVADAVASGEIIAIGRDVLTAACAQLAAWPGQNAGGVSVWVNVAPVQLLYPTFADDVIETLKSAGLDPGRLVLEITEDAAIDIERAADVLGRLRAVGVRVALDDFGTGYSSLYYLGQLPLDYLKIDRSLTAMICSDRGRALIVSTLALANELGLRTIAEGVETPEQLAAIRAADCHYAQGFLFSPPKPAAEMTLLMSGGRAQARGRHKNPAAVARGRLGGLKGGPSRAAKLSPEERREIARHAAQARWGVRFEP